MKKIINEPSNFVEESIEGLVKSHPDIYAFAPDNKRVITRAKKSSNKVGIVSGGGSGHLPVFTGYVGKGMLDACAVGSVFASPSVDQIASAIRKDDNGNGVLCVIGNYAIFRLNSGTKFLDFAISKSILIDSSPGSPMLTVTLLTYILTNFSIRSLSFPLEYCIA